MIWMEMVKSLLRKTGPRREAVQAISEQLDQAVEENRTAQHRRNEAVVRVLDQVVLGMNHQGLRHDHSSKAGH